jgi:TetR/AcrR family transcriptional repressor of uid operon
LAAAVLHEDNSGQPNERRSRILDAAERCFVRAGFHRATMQDVAAEAGMSPGNLYRYFPAKDAIVAALTERDRSRLARDFARLESGGDFITTFVQLGRKHFEKEPREKAILCLEIWAESSRNPALAALCSEFEQDVVRRLSEVLHHARVRGEVAQGVDVGAVATLIITLANGLFVRRAIAPDFDAEHEVAQVINLIEALLNGNLARILAHPPIISRP